VPLLSLEALHQMHIFIFVLAVSHVFFSATTMLLGGAKLNLLRHSVLLVKPHICSFSQLFHTFLFNSDTQMETVGG
jgi:hypothetical protein